MATLPVEADSVRSNPARPTDFERAVAHYRFALDRLRNEPDKSDDASDLLSDALTSAEDRLVRVPAANLEELRVKADVVWFDSASIPSADHLRHFFADLIRMTGGAPSIGFDPARWLARFERCGGMWAVRDGEALLLIPEGADLADVLLDLDMRGGRGAVLDLIRARHEAREA